jgi:guanylate kinase
MSVDMISFDLHHPKPLLIVISGPSGVGKDVVINEMRVRGQPFHFVITVASRERREGEQHGVDYFFVSPEEFEAMIAGDEFIEYAWVYETYKGVPKQQIEAALLSGKDVIMRLDVQGAAKVRTIYPEAVLIFLIPSSKEEWFYRLNERKSESPDSMRVRIETCLQEIARIPEFDYLVVNKQDCLSETADHIEAIIQSEHNRVEHREIKL